MRANEHTLDNAAKNTRHLDFDFSVFKYSRCREFDSEGIDDVSYAEESQCFKI